MAAVTCRAHVNWVYKFYSSLLILTLPMTSPPVSPERRFLWTAHQEVRGPTHLNSEVLPGLPHLLHEAPHTRRELSELLRAVELDIRQVDSLVVNKSWQRKGTEWEKMSFKLQWERYWLVTTGMYTRRSTSVVTMTMLLPRVMFVKKL